MDIYRYILGRYQQKWLVAVICPLLIFMLFTYIAGAIYYSVSNTLASSSPNVPAEQLADMNHVRGMYCFYASFFVIAVAGFMLEIIGDVLHDRDYAMLPEKECTKFSAAIIVCFAYMIGMALISVPMECLLHLWYQFGRVEACVEIGGFLSMFYKHTDLIAVVITFVCLSIFLMIMFRLKWIGLVAVLCSSGYFIGSSMAVSQVGERVDASYTIHYLIGIISVLLLITSWPLYKRWQPANNGFLMI